MKAKLQELGLENEIIDKVLTLHKEELNGNYIPKSRFDEVNNLKKEYETQVNDYSKQIEELKDSGASAKEMKDKMEALQQDFATKEQEYQNKLQNVTVNSALKLALNGKVHDVDIVSNLINRENLEIDENGNITKGLEDQIKPLQENKPFLFKQEQEQQRGIRRVGVGKSNPEPKEPTHLDAMAERLGLIK